MLEAHKVRKHPIKQRIGTVRLGWKEKKLHDLTFLRQILWNMLEICFGREKVGAHLNLCPLAKGLREQQPPRSVLCSGRGDGEVGVQRCV